MPKKHVEREKSRLFYIDFMKVFFVAEFLPVDAHVGLIVDGNRRYDVKGLAKRSDGHRVGSDKLESFELVPLILRSRSSPCTGFN